MRPDEQGLGEVDLDRLHLVADRGRGEVEFLGGQRETPQSCRRLERAQGK